MRKRNPFIHRFYYIFRRTLLKLYKLDKKSIGDFPLHSKSGFSIPDLEIYFLLEIINAKRDSLN